MIEIGSRLGRYEILEVVGRGGMSVVYRARDEKLKREVAVKVLHDFLTSQPEARARFHREAMAVARLHHPHIIEIHDYSGEDAERCYIVTEFIAGKAMTAGGGGRGELLPEMGLMLIRPIADALAHAHDAGVIHRDLKPENILIGDDGLLKLTDFGIARTVDHQNMTITGTLLGSPAYMAPEYIAGKPIDARVDIYAFGAMLYQLLTGELPFKGPTPAALLLSITGGSYRAPNELNQAIHGDIVRLISRCLAMDPDERFPTMVAVREEIDRLLDRLGFADGGSACVTTVVQTPEAFAATLLSDLPDVYLGLGQEALNQGETGEALDHFDRVLSLNPTHPGVHQLLDQIQRSAWRRNAAQIIAVGCLIAGMVTGGVWVWSQQPPPAPEAAAPVAAAPLEAAREPAKPQERNVPFIVNREATLVLNGEVVKQAVTGNIALLLTPGRHTVQVKDATGESTQEVVIPARGPINPIYLTLPTRPGKPARAEAARVKRRRVEFRTAGAWVNVELNGALVAKNKLGLFHLTLPYGEHVVRFSNDKAQPLEQQLRVSATEPPKVVLIRLKPREGRLLIRGAPEGAVVTVAGKRRLITALTRDNPILVPLTPGKGSMTYEVVISHGEKTFRKSVVFRPGETYTLALKGQAL
jgi:serine/threonine-protein kinase